jgi:hypothetical protein
MIIGGDGNVRLLDGWGWVTSYTSPCTSGSILSESGKSVAAHASGSRRKPTTRSCLVLVIASSITFFPAHKVPRH